MANSLSQRTLPTVHNLKTQRKMDTSGKKYLDKIMGDLEKNKRTI
jgi:hypothetical protein